jgi:hypothetical protein
MSERPERFHDQVQEIVREAHQIFDAYDESENEFNSYMADALAELPARLEWQRIQDRDPRYPRWLYEDYKFVEFRNIRGYLQRVGRFGDISSTYNQSVYKTKWTYLHNAALMYAMQAYGILNVEVIRQNISMFAHIPLSILNARTYRLLGCSSLKQINKFRCCPFKVQQFYQEEKQRILDAEGPTSKKLLHGLVLNSVSKDPARKMDEAVFIKRSFLLEPNAAEMAEELISITCLNQLIFPKVLICRGED